MTFVAQSLMRSYCYYGQIFLARPNEPHRWESTHTALVTNNRPGRKVTLK